MIKIKLSVIWGCVFLILGIASWFIGGSINKISLLYIFPRAAMPTAVMFFLWAIAFFSVGFIISGVMNGCEKYKRREVNKLILLLLFSYILFLCVYPTFFRALAPFVCFLILVASAFFLITSILISIRLYSFWSALIILLTVFITYNAYLSLAFAIVN